jgi:5-methylcytosine-specific restriction endonuclease McrA
LSEHIPERLRQFVARRAQHRCEYCLLHEDDSYTPHQVDHIVSRKHGGASDPPNLAYACLRCNLWKGTDAASLDPETNILVPLFNPRRDNWPDHFALRGVLIDPLTGTGAATIRLLKLNHEHRLAERELLHEWSRL